MDKAQKNDLNDREAVGKNTLTLIVGLLKHLHVSD